MQDGSAGLVAWLTTGTPVLRAGRADGRGKRDDPDTLFTTPLVQKRGVHAMDDHLRIAPTGRPWSVWVFFEEATRRFAGWYVNLERPHVRDHHAVYTSDHVLDLWVAPDRTVVRKDEDELVLAREQGLFDAAMVAAIEADADAVEQVVAAWGSPFCDGWEHVRPATA